MRASLGVRKGVCKVKNILSEKTKKSTSIKCIFSKLKFWPGKSKTSKFNTWNLGKSNIPQSICQGSQKLFTGKSKSQSCKCKSRKSKEVKTPLQTSIIGTCCEHDWNVFVTIFLKGLQNFLKTGNSCDLTF